MLDGSHQLEDIQRRVASVFSPDDLDACLQVLFEQNLLEDGADEAATAAVPRASIEPQLNYFHEIEADPHLMQERLSRARIAIAGAGALGSAAAMTLAAAGVGTLSLIDHLPVGDADPWLSAVYPAGDIGRDRVDALRDRIAGLNAGIAVRTRKDVLDSDDAVVDALGDADFLVCCLDPGLSSITYRFNRVCLKTGLKWISGSVSAFEGVVGPMVVPDSACYMCYAMRTVACTESPEDEFAFVRFLDKRKKDDSGRRENLVFAVGTVANLLGLETFKAVAGLAPATVGKVLVMTFQDLRGAGTPSCASPGARHASSRPTRRDGARRGDRFGGPAPIRRPSGHGRTW